MKREKGLFLKQIIHLVKQVRGKLLYEYILILLAVALAVVATFFISDYIVKYSATEQSKQSTDVIFGQAQEQIRIFEEDVDNLYNNAVQNESVAAYFQAENLYERWLYLEGFYQVVGNNMRLNRNLRNILLYNAEGELIVNKGDAYVWRADRNLENDQMTFSDKLIDTKTNEAFFEVGFPVYEEGMKQDYYQVGYVFLMFDVKYLQSVVDGALPNQESAVAILDSKGIPLVQAGQWKEEYQLFDQTQEEEENLIYVESVCGNGWKLVSIVPKDSMTSDVTLLQQVNMITYLMVLVALSMVCTLIFTRVIQPITKQTAFMSEFTKNTDKRIEVAGNNEIGELARKMNEMLDDIEQLNQEIIESQKKYLELEYAKKQTEMIAYKSQMNPHFLYNTFNCIRGMALYKGEKEIAEMTTALSSFFRYSIQGEDMVFVQDVLENLNHYARIIQYRFNGKYTINVEAAGNVYQYKIPKMLIQPLVENAVFHGLEPRTKNGQVWVSIVKKEGALEVRVDDNGGGISAENLVGLRQSMEYYDREEAIPNQKYGIGFLNVYRRVRLYYGDRAEFELNSKVDQGTQINMLLPV